jgi:putative flippase GtrA
MTDQVERWVPLPKGLPKFLAVGLVGLAVHTGVFTAVFALKAPKSGAWAAGLVLATLVTWSLNRKLTFAASGRKAHHEALRYVGVTLLAQSVSFTVFQTLTGAAASIPAPVDVILGAAAATVFSYLGNRHFTFAPPQAPKAEASEH